MKIIVLLENNVQSGGAFNQGINAILQMKAICRDNFELQVFSIKKENIEYLANFGIICKWVPLKFLDRVFEFLQNFKIWQILQKRIRILSPLEKTLKLNSCDLVYFLTQSSTASIIQDTNFIATVFDVCHREMVEFPEVRSFGKFRSIEKFFSETLPAAAIVITESEKLSEALIQYYGVDPKRCLAMPMNKSPYVAEYGADDEKILAKYNLVTGYYFYPAQFWAHKNHMRILEALILLREEGLIFNVVFVGGDKGNRSYVEDFIAKNLLQNQVRILGFVPAEDMNGLYYGSVAVVMPTYFGPTNLPPLEAWFFRRPLIYSEGMNDQAGNAAIYVDPDSSRDISLAMKACLDKDTYDILIEQGIMRLKYFNSLRELSEIKLKKMLIKYENRRRCWG